MSDYYYERLNEDFELERCPLDDKERKITGKYILNVPKWFGENPEERKRLGWIKHITYSDEEIMEKWPHTMSQYLVKSTKQVDDYTVEDDYHVMDKSEEQMLFEEMLEVAGWGSGSGIVFL